MRRRRFIALLCGLLTATIALAAKEMKLTLRFTPKEPVTVNVPVMDSAKRARMVEIQPLVDARGLPDESLVGENRENKKARPIRATSSVAAFATEALRKCLSEWGVRLGAGDLVLTGEITNLFVTEGETYSTASSIRFRIGDATGRVLWQGTAAGDAHQWGRSFSAENYNEQVSDALKKTFASLVSNPEFQKAWSGDASKDRLTVLTPPEAKTKVLAMLASRVAEDLVVTYLKGVQVRPTLTPEEIVDWKNAQIGESIIRAAIARE